MSTKRVLLAIAALVPSLLAFAQQPVAQQPVAGMYITEGGWGTLDVRRNGAFALETLGVNGHSCSIEGTMVQGRAAVKPGCTLVFGRRGQAIQLTTDSAPGEENGCQSFCSMRANFETTYHPEPPACRPAVLQKERAAYLEDVKAARFRPAAARLEKLVGACGRWLWWMTAAEIRNDLAVAQHRAGRSKDCLATYAPLEDLLGPNPQLPPMEEEWAKGVVPQMRANREACARAVAARPR